MLNNKIKFSQKLIEQWLRFYNGKDNKLPLQLANFGGKDSLVIYTLTKQVSEHTGINLRIINTNTTIDPPGTKSYIKQFMPDTIILQPKETFYELVRRKAFPSRLNRYCCQFLKEYAGKNYATIEGVRAVESAKRRGRDFEECDRRKNYNGKHLYPIYEWTDEDVWEFINKNNLEVAPCYKDGLKRLGCVGCPQVTKKGIRQKEFDLYPKYYQAIKKAITLGMKENEHWKISRYCNGDGEKAMQWWLSQQSMRDYFGYDIKFIRKNKKT
jgi:phosphoadenosine phosphosulfate reductase